MWDLVQKIIDAYQSGNYRELVKIAIKVILDILENAPETPRIRMGSNEARSAMAAFAAVEGESEDALIEKLKALHAENHGSMQSGAATILLPILIALVKKLFPLIPLPF